MLFNRILQQAITTHGVLLSIKHQFYRSVSILNSLHSSPVLISNNRDVYTNLALEHWLYNNLKFVESDNNQSDNHNDVFNSPIVLIWTDEPCVVIGRHQNPWLESTLGFINKAGIKLARRHSGGGCVYHDENNINISIIGHRRLFENRQENLRFLANVLDERYQLKFEPTKRHDLVHKDTGLKISGSAAKLGKHNCYHHFTLLVDTDKEVLETAIRQTKQDFIVTNSTQSTKSKVINLRELNPGLDVDRVVSDLAIAYGKHYGGIASNKGKNSAAKSSKVEGDSIEFSSLQAYRDELTSWNWIYGRTPRFKLEKTLKLLDNGEEKQILFRVTINKGMFEKIDIEGDLSIRVPDHHLFDFLLGTSFTYKDAVTNIVKLLQEDPTKSASHIGSEQIFATFLLQMVHESNY